MICSYCKSEVYDSNPKELECCQNRPKSPCNPPSSIFYVYDGNPDGRGERAALYCVDSPPMNITVSGSSRVSGTYEYIGEHHDGFPVFMLEFDDKKPLYLFKRGETWRISTDRFEQTVLAYFSKGNRLFDPPSKESGVGWTLYSKSAKRWKLDPEILTTRPDGQHLPPPLPAPETAEAQVESLDPKARSEAPDRYA